MNKIIMFLFVMIFPLTIYSFDLRIDNEMVPKFNKYFNNEYGWSPLNYAIEIKDFKSALIIATYCEDFNQRDPVVHQEPPIRNKSSQKVNALERLLYRARITQCNIETVLTEEQLEILYVLLGRGIEIDGGLAMFSPLIGACFFGVNDLIIRFAEHVTNKDELSGFPLYYVIRRGDLDMARFLESKGANLKRYQLLNAAIESQKCEVVDFLLKSGANLSEGPYVRHAFDLIQQEIKNLDKCPNNKFPALEIFRFILEKGANPNFGIPKGELNLTDYKRAVDLCSLKLALELPSITNAQYFYKNYVVQILLDHGAVVPCVIPKA